MLKWIRLKRECGIGIKAALLLLLCFYILYRQHSMCDDKDELQVKHAKHLLVENCTVATKRLSFRVRHLKFRQKRIIGVNLGHGKTIEHRNGERLRIGKIQSAVPTQRKPQVKPKVIIKKHAVFRQRKFVLVRKKGQMGKTNRTLIYRKKAEN